LFFQPGCFSTGLPREPEPKSFLTLISPVPKEMRLFDKAFEVWYTEKVVYLYIHLNWDSRFLTRRMAKQCSFIETFLFKMNELC
jgi:hypothetical protein